MQNFVHVDKIFRWQTTLSANRPVLGLQRRKSRVTRCATSLELCTRVHNWVVIPARSQVCPLSGCSPDWPSPTTSRSPATPLSISASSIPARNPGCVTILFSGGDRTVALGFKRTLPSAGRGRSSPPLPYTPGSGRPQKGPPVGRPRRDTGKLCLRQSSFMPPHYDHGFHRKLYVFVETMGLCSSALISPTNNKPHRRSAAPKVIT